MTQWQQVIVFVYGVIALFGTIKALYESSRKKGAYGYVYSVLRLYGAFVWGDMVVFGLFWTLASAVSLLLHDWILFLLAISLFWLVRSLGETQYWFHQQFTPQKGNPPEKFLLYKIFKSDAVWFVNQIGWQCVAVVTIITSLYLAKLWLGQ